MTYAIIVLPKLDDKLRKMAKKERGQYERIREKVREIAQDPHHYKPLGNVMTGKRRVHIGSFVLVFSIDEEHKRVIFEDFDHHDKIYQK